MCVCVCVCVLFLLQPTNAKIYSTIFSLYIIFTLCKEKILIYICALVDYNKNNMEMQVACIKIYVYCFYGTHSQGI